MNGFNKVILAGNLTRDPELRYTPKGTAAAKIGLAVNRKWRDDSGAEKEAVTFVNVEVWGKQAEALSQYKKKGQPLLIEGYLKLDTWDDKQTAQKRSAIVVVAEGVTFLDSANAPQGQPRNAAQNQRPSR